MLVCVVGVCLCSFLRWFFRLVVFGVCGFFVGVARFSCFLTVFVPRAFGPAFGAFRSFVLTMFFVVIVGLGGRTEIFPRVIID